MGGFENDFDKLDTLALVFPLNSSVYCGGLLRRGVILAKGGFRVTCWRATWRPPATGPALRADAFEARGSGTARNREKLRYAKNYWLLN